MTAGQLLLGGAALAGAGAMILNDQDQGNRETAPADEPASTPTGQKASPIDVKQGTKRPSEIDGRVCTGHGSDQMQGRGIAPSAVEDAIRNGRQSPGKTPITKVHSGDNGVVVVTGSGGQVITVIPK